MGATISQDHVPEQFEALKKAKQAYWKHCGVTPREQWLALPDTGVVVPGLSRIRILQVGSTDPTAPLVLFVHGGGGLASDWTPLMKQLAATTKQHRCWFLDRPGHGLMEPFDYLALQETMGAHAAAYIDAVRRAAGVDQMDLVGNSAGGAMAYFYAKEHKEHLRSFTWIGAPAFFRGQNRPVAFSILGSRLGSQLMARPPPSFLPSRILVDMFRSDPGCVPEEYVELYRAAMSCRNTSLSWSYLLRNWLTYSDKYDYSLETLDQALEGIPSCTLIVGDSEPFITNDQIAVIEAKFGKQALVIGKGHIPWHDDPGGVAAALCNILQDSS